MPQKSLSYRTQCTGKGEEAVPLFYNVSPSQVAHPADQSHGGPFAEAFQGHESRGEYGPQEIDEWKAALFALSNLSTWSKHADHWSAVIGIMRFYFAAAVYQSSGVLLGLALVRSKL